MCGIVGHLNHYSQIDRSEFDLIRDTLKHRGPDGAGTWISGNGKIALGHRRLSFLDLSDDGAQPMSNETEKLWLTFNGEIYNYLELKKELLGHGHVFKSNSDSEVLLHGYEEWGIDELLSKLIGMFAFGIWDDYEHKLVLARDRFGIKPLYYTHQNNSFLFGSELKAIVSSELISRQVDYSAVADFLCYRYVPSPKTIWRDIKKLEPAHYLIYDFERKEISQHKEYWKLKNNDAKQRQSKIVSKADALLENSIKQHIRSDVPIGAFLSGGYDSSAIVSYLDRLDYPTNTFSIGFDKWNESEHKYAQIVADTFNMPLYTKIADDSNLELLDTLVYHYDEPLADISIIPTYMVSALAAEKHKAVLSGEGADEIFCGYWWQKNIKYLDLYNKFGHNSIKQFAKRVIKGYKPIDKMELYEEAMAMGRWTSESLSEILHPSLHKHIPKESNWFYRKHLQEDLSPLKSFQYLDMKTFMGELVLTKIDRASMANSLEVRVPFLDHRLFEYMFQFHEDKYYSHNETKIILKRNIQNSLPKEILNRSKQGFVGPDIFYQNIEWYKINLEEGLLIQNNIISKKGLNTLFSNKSHWHLWKLLILEKWWSKWM